MNVFSITIFSLALGATPLMGNPITLEELCEPYREESFNDGIKLVRLSHFPEIDEEKRLLIWTKNISFGDKPFWKTREGYYLDDKYHVQHQFWAIYLNHFRNLIQTTSPDEAIIGGEAIKKKFDEFYKNRAQEIVNRFAEHAGFQNGEDIKFPAKTRTLKPGESITFGAMKFTASKEDNITLVTPHEAEGNKNGNTPYILRVYSGEGTDFEFRDGGLFEPMVFVRIELFTEEGTALVQGKHVVVDDDGKKRYVLNDGNSDPLIATIGAKLKIGNQTIQDRVETMFVDPENMSDLFAIKSYPGDSAGVMIHAINGEPVRTAAQLNALLAKAPEKLGEKFSVTFFKKVQDEQRRVSWKQVTESISPDYAELKRQKLLLAEQARIEEEARQSVITLHEEERARIRKEVIEFRKQAELEVLKTKEGIIDLVRQRVQPAIMAFTQELASDDPLWAISYLKYLAHAQPDALTVKQREKLFGVVWMNQVTRLDSYFHLNLENPDTTKVALENGVSLTLLNTKPTKVSVAKGEMVFNDGDSYLPLDHPKVLLEFILDDAKDSLSSFDTFRISDCGVCTPNEYFYFEREKRKEFEQLSFSRQKDSLAAYQEIVTAPRDYESYDVPKPTRRTLTGLLFKGWVFATVSANVMLLGAEAVGMDTDELLNEAQKGALEPKPSTQIKVTKMIGQWDKMSTWTGNRKGHVESYKLSSGGTVQIYKIEKNNGSFSSRIPGWFVGGETALKHGLRTQKSFETREAVISYIERSVQK